MLGLMRIGHFFRTITIEDVGSVNYGDLLIFIDVTFGMEGLGLEIAGHENPDPSF